MPLAQLNKQAMDRLDGQLFNKKSPWVKQHRIYCSSTEMALAYQRIADAMVMDGLDAARVSVKIKNIQYAYLKNLSKIGVSADENMVEATVAETHCVVELRCATNVRAKDLVVSDDRKKNCIQSLIKCLFVTISF